MYSFFSLSGLITYIYYLKDKVKSEERKAMSKDFNNLKFKIQNSKFYFLGFFLFILSLLSKAPAVTFPLVLLLIDYFKGRINLNTQYAIRNTQYVIEKLPFFILAIIFGIIAIHSQKSVVETIDIAPLNSIFDRIFLVSYSISFYIIKLLIPAGLCAIHPYPIKSSGMLPAEYYLSAVFITGIVILVILII